MYWWEKCISEFLVVEDEDYVDFFNIFKVIKKEYVFEEMVCFWE